MPTPIVVQIIGAPIACAEGIKDGWRETANWAARQLKVRFGDAVRVEYYDLFDPQCPPIPADAQLPLVLIAGQMISSGGKLPLPTMRKHIEGLLTEANNTQMT